MTYELAKQLKDAGFPQKILAGAGDGHLLQDYVYGIVYAPTLSELIEACGKNFRELKGLGHPYRLTLLGIRPDGTHKDWSAISTNKIECFGQTPEEAVAALYLKLHENDKKD